MNNEAHAIADDLGAAIFARDANLIRAVYHDDISVWHGSTGIAQSKDENVSLLSGVFSITSSLQYVDIKRHDIPGGVIQQHRLVGAFDNGKPLPDLFACLVIMVSDGKISRIEEYFDGSVYSEVFARAAESRKSVDRWGP